MTGTLEVFGGTDRTGQPEAIEHLVLNPGESIAVIGPTGSGKSELLADIEQLAEGDTPSRRTISYTRERGDIAQAPVIVATLSQRTNFIMDISVRNFVTMHAAGLKKTGRDWVEETVALANTLCGEPLEPSSRLQRLSGGQTRALMIADIALISDAPVVLIDEVENAGIDKHLAMRALAGQGKITVIATHDPILMLESPRRLVMGGGGMRLLLGADKEETDCLEYLARIDSTLLRAREIMRLGQRLNREVLQ
jgi:ABC-type lipoprotein export system ATPase subunit